IGLARAEVAMRDFPRSWTGIHSDCDPIPLEDGCATVVVASEVMEHVDDPARFLAELARIGKPSARYLISVPDPASESLMRIVAPDWYWKRPYPQHVFDHRQLDSLIRAAGLEIVARHHVGFYDALWWTFRMALGAEPGEPAPQAALLQAWE